MKIRNFSKKLNTLLKFYESKGGVIDFNSLEREQGDALGYSMHEYAVKMALTDIGKKTNRPVDSDYTRMKGHEITVKDFVGSHFSFERNALIVRGKTPAHLNDYFVAGDAETPTNIMQVAHGEYITDGYAAAFADPPYPLQLDAVALNQLFLQINDLLFGGLSTNLEIFDWSGTWSRYFEAGAEWWGSYFWTVFNKETRQIVAIGASTTD